MDIDSCSGYKNAAKQMTGAKERKRASVYWRSDRFLSLCQFRVHVKISVQAFNLSIRSGIKEIDNFLRKTGNGIVPGCSAENVIQAAAKQVTECYKVADGEAGSAALRMGDMFCTDSETVRKLVLRHAFGTPDFADASADRY